MKMLNMIWGKTLRDDLQVMSVSNETIHKKTSVKKTKEFLRKQRLRWFGDIKKMDDEKGSIKGKKFCSQWFKKGQIEEKMEREYRKRHTG